MSENVTAHGLKKKAFLAAFRKTGNVRLACEAAEVGRSSHYRWLEADAAYEEAFEPAREDAADILEAEAKRRAVEGVEEPAGWYRGRSMSRPLWPARPAGRPVRPEVVFDGAVKTAG